MSSTSMIRRSDTPVDPGMRDKISALQFSQRFGYQGRLALAFGFVIEWCCLGRMGRYAGFQAAKRFKYTRRRCDLRVGEHLDQLVESFPRDHYPLAIATTYA
jgi:hypothetical protein